MACYLATVAAAAACPAVRATSLEFPMFGSPGTYFWIVTALATATRARRAENFIVLVNY